MKENEDKGLRYNKGKRKWSLVHFESLEPMVEVLEFGAEKYGAENWKKGLDPKEILESMQRHLGQLIDKLNNNEDLTDKESGLLLMGHIQCNAMFFNYMIKHK